MTVAALIRQYARRYGIDPRAALAVASVEGGIRSGAVGDQGTSFGPFQLHVGGALPRGRGAGWANSPAGIAYALRRMAASGARGLTGRAAVEAIVRNFERPANPGAEIQRALGQYGGAAAAPGGPAYAGAAAVASQGDARVAVLQALIRASQGHDPGSRGIISTLGRAGQQQRAQASQVPSPAAMSPSPGAGDGSDIAELFYDPLGSIKNGRAGGPIGGHADHVHFSATSPGQMLAAIRQAQRMGLHVGENPYVGPVAPVHVEGSYHYRDFPGTYRGRKLGEAIDVIGNAALMARYFKWVRSHL